MTSPTPPAPHALFGGITPARFISDYWHKKPLLVRQAIPSFAPVLTRSELFDLARRDDVESRLITHFDQDWQLQSGPIKKFPGLRQKNWTLLLQGANLHSDGADALMQQFRFLSDARLDDLMISYASDGGGVGPHVDSYDVFLLQAHGKRRWSISDQQELEIKEGLPLKILRDFRPQQEFILEPGDMLYLPPHYAHNGVAISECMTYSIGFRAPSFQELGENFLQFMADTMDLPGRYADPDAKPARRPAQLPAAMVRQVAAQLSQLKFDADDIAVFLGEYLSESKAQTRFDAPTAPLTRARFLQAAIRHGVALSRKTRMLHSGRYIFINGESYQVKTIDKQALSQLADARTLDGAPIAKASDDLREALYLWYQDGWLEPIGKRR